MLGMGRAGIKRSHCPDFYSTYHHLRSDSASAMTSKQVPHFQAENPMKSAQLFMTKGTGAMSYAENSNWHAMCMEKIWPTVLELVDSMKLPDDDMSIITIADLGCAPGRNTINNVETVLKRVKERYRNGHIPEFQAFFQDLYDTDFNTLFQLFKNSVATIAENVPETLKYFPAGVPGSFYGRVFPRSSVHFVMSTFALHWISKVPLFSFLALIPSAVEFTVTVQSHSLSIRIPCKVDIFRLSLC